MSSTQDNTDECEDKLQLQKLVVEKLLSQEPCIPNAYRYDHIGSLLNEEYNRTWPYYVHFVEEALIRENAAGIVRHLAGRCGFRTLRGKHLNVIDLGCGTSTKACHVLHAALLQGCQTPVRYTLVDISAAALATLADTVRAEFAACDVTLEVKNGYFETALRELSEDGHLIANGDTVNLVCCFGVTLQQVESSQQRQLLRQIARTLTPGSPASFTPDDAVAQTISPQRSPKFYLLTGFDLTESENVLRRAYMDHPISWPFLTRGLARVGEELLEAPRPLDITPWRLEWRFVKGDAQNYLTFWVRAQEPQTWKLRACHGGQEIHWAEGDIIKLHDDLQNNSKFSRRHLDAFLAESGYGVVAEWAYDGGGSKESAGTRTVDVDGTRRTVDTKGTRRTVDAEGTRRTADAKDTRMAVDAAEARTADAAETRTADAETRMVVDGDTENVNFGNSEESIDPATVSVSRKREKSEIKNSGMDSGERKLSKNVKNRATPTGVVDDMVGKKEGPVFALCLITARDN